MDHMEYHMEEVCQTEIAVRSIFFRNFVKEGWYDAFFIFMVLLCLFSFLFLLLIFIMF